jgi:hypothetical protein
MDFFSLAPQDTHRLIFAKKCIGMSSDRTKIMSYPKMKICLLMISDIPKNRE